MNINFDFNQIPAALSGIWDAARNETDILGQTISNFGNEALQSAPVLMSSLVAKAQAVWNLALPYINSAVEFTHSNLGLAGMLLGATIFCMHMSHGADNHPVQSILWITAGVVAAVASGALIISTTNLIPPGYFTLAAVPGI